MKGKTRKKTPCQSCKGEESIEAEKERNQLKLKRSNNRKLNQLKYLINLQLFSFPIGSGSVKRRVAEKLETRLELVPAN